MCLAVQMDTSEHEPSQAAASICVDRQGFVAMVTLNRPDTLNALTPQMGPEYASILRSLDADPNVRCIVVTGAGRGFCSGADLTALSGSSDDLQAYVAGQSIATLPLIALMLSTPVVTAINGPCAGIGFVLAVSADVRFVHPDATLSTTFARLGLVAEYGIAWLLPRLIGLPAATDLLLTGKTITGKQAGELGLAQVSDDPLGDAMEWAEQISRNCSPSSVATMKRQLLHADGQALPEAVQSSLGFMSQAFTWPDLAEALTAKAEKRPPYFPAFDTSGGSS
jgi:enoyl-CoA hydratase/carnithine racemase